MKNHIYIILALTSLIVFNIFADHTSESKVTKDFQSILAVENISIGYVPGAKTAALYCTFHGLGQGDITISRLESSLGKAVIHKHSTNQQTGVHEMQNIDQIVVPQGVMWNLADHHQHIMFTNLQEEINLPIDLIIYYTSGSDLVEKSLTIKVDLNDHK